MAIDLQAAIAVFDKSADRTRPNAQTEAWAVIRAELMRVMDAPVARPLELQCAGFDDPQREALERLVKSGKRVRLVEEPTNGD